MLLSYIYLLAPSGTINWCVFLYDATVDYFGPDHIPSKFLAAAISILFKILPLILVFLHLTGLLQNRLLLVS